MTAVRPESAPGPSRPSPTTLGGEPAAHGAYFEDTAEFEAAVDRLADPLNDPLPVPGSARDDAYGPYASGYGAGAAVPAGAAPRPGRSGPGPGQPAPGPTGAAHGGAGRTATGAAHVPTVSGQAPAGRTPAGPDGSPAAPWPSPDAAPTAALPVVDGAPGTGGRAVRRRAAQVETTARLPLVEPAGGPAQRPLDQPHGTSAPGGRAARRRGAQAEAVGQLPVAEPESGAAPGGRAARRRAARGPLDPGGQQTQAAPPEGGRAARRKAAKHGAARRTTAEAPAAQQPTSRLEARRAARAAKDSPSVVISRAVGELFITLGVLMLLFVAYQLWWTNVLAHEASSSAANSLQHQWDSNHSANDDRNPGAFSPGQGFAIIYIPKLDVKAPIAEGTDKHKILDQGMVGHYSGAQETAMPWAKTGNFALAGHRNTHGEPFRYINKLVPGDKVVVETASTYYTYQITSFLPQTSPSNVGVIQPVPVGSGFTRPGRYITLTTCTPEFTSTYRMIVWGRMVDVRPRSQGKPDALLGG